MSTRTSFPAAALLTLASACAAHHAREGGGELDPTGGKADEHTPPHHGSHGNLPAAPALLAHPEWDATGALAPALAVDLEPDPGVVEVELTAAETTVELLPGQPTTVWTYNGTLPGPRIDARVGDRVVVHVTNALPEATSVHWHGVRLPNGMDGVTPIAPGASFTFEFDALDAGVYWYHPHVATAVQVDRGLYGMLVVRDPSEPALPVASTHTLALDDMLVDAATGAQDTTSTDARVDMMGREGNLLLVNGRPANGTLTVRAGEWQRLQLVNAANARYFRLMVDGGELVKLGGEAGGLEAPEPVTDVMLVPGDRVDVLVRVSAPSSTAVLEAVGYERAVGAGLTEAAPLLRFEADTRPAATPELPATWGAFVGPSAPIGTRAIQLSEVLGADGSVAFLVNGAAFPDGPVALAKEGTVERWRIMNHTGMDHPFHLHGFFFNVVGTREWQDTVNIRPHRAMDVDVVFGARPGSRGRWMYHCHILEHGDAGMMAEVDVGDSTGWYVPETDAGTSDADASASDAGTGHHH